MNSEHDSFDGLQAEAYFAGTLPPGDRLAFERWMAAEPARMAVVERFRVLWEARQHPTPFMDDRAAAKARILSAVRGATAVEHRPGMPGTPAATRASRLPDERGSTATRFGIRAWQIGGGLAAAFLLTLVVRQHRAGSGAAPAQTYATTTGQRTTVTLPDGSHVTLAPQTRLVIQDGFGTQHRTIVLQGQAYFEVGHDASHPFTVKTGTIETRVLGTAFDVKRYADDHDVRVVVASGKVAVGAPQRTAVTLIANTMGVVTDSTAVVSPVNDVQSYTGWTGGALDFKEVLVPEMLQTLSRWYGVRFALADSSLVRERVTTYLRYDNTADVIATLQTVLNVKASYTKTSEGPVVTLASRRRAVHPAPNRRDRTREFSPIMEKGR